ncbi:MAG: molybdopterin molybdotransferase MoeA, partial [Pseudonocardiaceae bacterium]
RAQMDGDAVRAADVQAMPARLRVAGEAVAGQGWHHELTAGAAVRIMTGAPVPAGADAVQKVEVTRELKDSHDDPIVEIKERVKVGQNIVERAYEVTAGAIVLRAGERITATRMAALAAFGYAQVAVGARPRVGVLATGSELVKVNEQPQPDQIRDSNSYTLATYSALAGAKVTRLPLAGDDEASLTAVIKKAAAKFDVLILSGGVSMGVYDFTKKALYNLGAEVFFERVQLRPGKPTVFARLEKGAHKTLIFGLPGNPVSVAVTCNLFARVALLQMQGATQTALPTMKARLTQPVKGSAGRAAYLPATLTTNAKGKLHATPLKWGGSADFVAFTQTQALMIVPADAKRLEAKAIVEVVLLPE